MCMWNNVCFQRCHLRDLKRVGLRLTLLTALKIRWDKNYFITLFKKASKIFEKLAIWNSKKSCYRLNLIKVLTEQLMSNHLNQLTLLAFSFHPALSVFSQHSVFPSISVFSWHSQCSLAFSMFSWNSQISSCISQCSPGIQLETTTLY